MLMLAASRSCAGKQWLGGAETEKFGFWGLGSGAQGPGLLQSAGAASFALPQPAGSGPVQKETS